MNFTWFLGILYIICIGMSDINMEDDINLLLFVSTIAIMMGLSSITDKLNDLKKK